MSSKGGQVFPAFAGGRERPKAAGFQRLPPLSGLLRPNAGSEPLRAALVGGAIAVVAVAVIAAVAAAVVAIPVEIAIPPTLAAAAELAIHSREHRQTTLLAVIQRLVERVGRVSHLLHGSRRSRHVLGALAQAR